MARVKKSKSFTDRPNSKVSHLALPLELDNEDHHATLSKR